MQRALLLLALPVHSCATGQNCAPPCSSAPDAPAASDASRGFSQRHTGTGTAALALASGRRHQHKLHPRSRALNRPISSTRTTITPLKPMSRHAVSVTKDRALVLVHIPKTGGTAIEAWARKHRVSFHSAHEHQYKGCCSSLIRASSYNNSPDDVLHHGATSRRHCLSLYSQSHADPGEETFCFVRDVLARAVSTYNMRAGKARPGCDQHRLNKWLVDTYLLRGDVDNHDKPQAAFVELCERTLCYERLQSDFSALLASMRNFSSVRLPQVRHGVKSTCNSTHLSAQVREMLLSRYPRDVELHAQTCGLPASSRSFHAPRRTVEHFKDCSRREWCNRGAGAYREEFGMCL